MQKTKPGERSNTSPYKLGCYWELRCARSGFPRGSINQCECPFNKINGYSAKHPVKLCSAVTATIRSLALMTESAVTACLFSKEENVPKRTEMFALEEPIVSVKTP